MNLSQKWRGNTNPPTFWTKKKKKKKLKNFINGLSRLRRAKPAALGGK